MCEASEKLQREAADMKFAAEYCAQQHQIALGVEAIRMIINIAGKQAEIIDRLMAMNTVTVFPPTGMPDK